MAETWYDEAFDVVGDAVIASLDKRECLGRSEQGERTARTDAEFESVRLSGRVDDLQEVIDQHFVKTHLGDHVLQLDDVGVRHYLADQVKRI